MSNVLGAGGQLLMPASQGRPKGGVRATFGFGVVTLLLLPSQIGYQDLAALLGQAPSSAGRLQRAALVSPFGTVHEQRLNLPQPVGASVPVAAGYTLASFDPGAGDLGAMIRQRGLGDGAHGRSDAAAVDRSRKGDFAASRKGDRLTVATRSEQAAPLAQRR